MSGKHSAQTASDGIHIVHAYEYASASAREAASGFTSDDVGKIALQTDDNSLWALLATTPVWVHLGERGKRILEVDSSHRTLEFVLSASTTDATVTEMFLPDGSTRMVLPSNASWRYYIEVTGRESTSGDEATYTFQGLINNDGGTTAIIDSDTGLYSYESDSNWDCAVSADDTNDALTIDVTGVAATDIEWSAYVRVVEVITA